MNSTAQHAPDPRFATLLNHLHRGGEWGFWAFESEARNEETGYPVERESLWWPAHQRKPLPRPEGKGGLRHFWYGVHPCTEIPRASAKGKPTQPKWVRSQVDVIASVNCLYAEYDEKDYGSKDQILLHIQQLPLQPTALIDSGGGFHAYWLLAYPWVLDDDSRAEAKRLQHGWVKFVGGDPGAKNLNRVLRVPGTYNVKEKYKTDEGFPRVHIVECQMDRLYKREDFVGLVPVEAEVAYTESKPVKLDGIAEAAQLLDLLAPYRVDEYDDWLRVGMALACLGSAGFSLWDTWSRKSGKYDPKACQNKWKTFDDSGHGLVTISTLAGMAKEDSPDDFARIFKRQPKESTPALQLKPQPKQDSNADVIVEVGSRTFVFGQQCYVEQEKKVDGEVRPVKSFFASQVWPEQKYHQIEDDQFGVRFRFCDHRGEWRHGIIPHGATIDNSAASNASSKAASAGVQIAPGSKGAFAQALGFWAEQSDDLVSLVRTPGWHEHVYVNGTNIYGATNWFADEMDKAIQRRSCRAGTLAKWKDLAKDALTTNGMLAALGISMVGPMVGLLDVVPFGLHLCGYSSHGKSTAARLAASLWGDPVGMFQSWDTTLRALEALADAADGACLVLDEIKRFEGDSKDLSSAIHSICSQQGRARLDMDSSLKNQKRWENTVLSTGEVRTQDMLGEHFQGGHRVRLVDVWVEAGDLTASAAHAALVDRLSHECHGVFSDAWVEQLLRITQADLRHMWDEFTAYGQEDERTHEEQRVHRNLALVASALEIGRQAGLLPIGETKSLEVLLWLREATATGNEEAEQATPNERAWALLGQWETTQPYRFPHPRNAKNAREVVAYRVPRKDDPEEHDLWTTEQMLRASKIDTLAGVNVREWLKFLVGKKRATDAGRQRLEGMQRRWFVLNCDTF